MKLNINTDASVVFTNKLEKLHRSALPVAIRSTLNSAAFNVKQETMPKTSKDAFVNRKPNFFKANSRVDMARGFNVEQMKATVGFTGAKLQGSKNFAVKDLEQQEYGGTIKGRSFIPTDKARGGSSTKPVRPTNRLSKIKSVVNSNKGSGKNSKEKYVRSAIHAGKGGYIIGNFPKRTLYKITSIIKSRSGTKIKQTPIYSFEENRNVKVKSTGFMKKASNESAENLEKYYEREAKKQIERLTK